MCRCANVQMEELQPVMDFFQFAHLHICTFAHYPLYLQQAGLTRPAPAELPQDRKVARVGGCSGAM